MNLLDVKDWDKGHPYSAYDVVCVTWDCGFCKRLEFYRALVGSSINENVNKNPISFPVYWMKLEIHQ